jgi:hypothetical protein
LNPDLDADSDPEFQVNPDTDPDPIQIKGFADQKLKKKNFTENFFISFFDQKLQSFTTSKNEIY